MNTEKSSKIPVFYPSTSDEAARFLDECSSIRRSGYQLRVSVLESPFQEFRPGGAVRRIGSAKEIRLPAAAEGVRGAPVAAVSLGRMTGVIELSRDDLLISALSGTPFSRLQEEAGRHGLFIPFEPEAPFGDRTAGALLMDGTASRLEGRYGRLRECILSVEIASASGSLIHSGSRSVKDVTGYEIAGFLAGSGGRAGAVTKIVFRLYPAPGSIATAAFDGPFESLVRLAGKVRDRSWPASLELFNPAATRLLSSRHGSRLAGARRGSGLLVCELHSAEKEIEKEMIEALRPLPEGVRLAAEDFSIRKAKEEMLAGLAGTGAEPGAVRLAADAERPAEAPGSAVASWMRLFPHRMNFVWKRTAGKDDGPPQEVARLVEENIAPGASPRAELMMMREGKNITTRIDPPRADTGKLDERVSAVFDPEGIMER